MGDSSFFWVEPGDLILSGQFAWEGAVALASAGEAGCVVSHRYPVYSGTKRATTAYLLAFFRTKMGDFILNEASRGSAGRNRPLNVNRLEKEKIPIPSATLQARIGEIVSLEMEIRRKIQTSIDLLQEHRSALITAAVTGQIDVATWGKRGTTDRRLDAIEADMAVAAHPEQQQVRA
jgi:type I restriction enzyme S subunit